MSPAVLYSTVIPPPKNRRPLTNWDVIAINIHVTIGPVVIPASIPHPLTNFVGSHSSHPVSSLPPFFPFCHFAQMLQLGSLDCAEAVRWTSQPSYCERSLVLCTVHFHLYFAVPDLDRCYWACSTNPVQEIGPRPWTRKREKSSLYFGCDFSAWYSFGKKSL